MTVKPIALVETAETLRLHELRNARRDLLEWLGRCYRAPPPAWWERPDTEPGLQLSVELLRRIEPAIQALDNEIAALERPAKP